MTHQSTTDKTPELIRITCSKTKETQFHVLHNIQNYVSTSPFPLKTQGDSKKSANIKEGTKLTGKAVEDKSRRTRVENRGTPEKSLCSFSKQTKMHGLTLMTALLVASTWKRSQAQLTYTIKPTWLDDPEYFTTISQGENRWKTLKDGAENLGLTFAGKAEFPWIVDIRLENKNQDYWSVGNLVKTDTVFTCCRCIEELGDLKSGSTTARIYFCQMYVFEYNQRDNPTSTDWLLGGSRFVKGAQKHAKCNIQEQYYDGGIITLVNPILPSPPTITLMPISTNYANGKLPEFSLQQMEAERRICYIASYGKNFANIKDHLTLDFKVKYRVYYQQMELCNRNAARMCPNRYLGQSACRIGGGNPTVEGKELMCFQARAKVGVVCDHDKGAPLVCDGIVFGLVILGVREEMCNDLLQVPFYVQKVTMFVDYFQANKEGGGRRSINRRARARSSRDSSFQPNRIQLVPIIAVSYLVSS